MSRNFSVMACPPASSSTMGSNTPSGFSTTQPLQGCAWKCLPFIWHTLRYRGDKPPSTCHLPGTIPGGPEGLWGEGFDFAHRIGPTITHPVPLGNQILIKSWKDGSPTSQLNPTWKGPFTVLLSTPIAIEVPGIFSWIHHSWIKVWKGDEGEDLPAGWQCSCEPPEDLRPLFRRVPDKC